MSDESMMRLPATGTELATSAFVAAAASLRDSELGGRVRELSSDRLARVGSGARLVAALVDAEQAGDAVEAVRLRKAVSLEAEALLALMEGGET